MVQRRVTGGNAGGRRGDSAKPKRSTVLTLRVSEAERRRLERAAQRLNLTVSALLRAAALDLDADARVASNTPPARTNSHQEDVATGELKELRGQVKRLGTNLNQLTRLSNRNGRLVTRDESGNDMSQLLVETRDTCREVLSALGARGHG